MKRFAGATYLWVMEDLVEVGLKDLPGNMLGGNWSKRCSHVTVFGGKSFFEPHPSPHKTNNQRRFLLASPSPPPTPPPPPPPPESLPLRRRQLSREGSGCGGRSHHWIHHHLQRILPPTTPPAPPPAASAEIATITINPADVAIAAVSTQSYYSWGRRSVTEGGERRRYRRGRRQA